MNTANNAKNSFDLYDKGMELVTKLLGEDIADIFHISVVNNICRIIVPAHISLANLGNNVTVLLKNTTSEIVVH